jgi:DNA-binding NarL/FixJ family response regulator
MLRILVADDHAVVRRGLRQLFEEHPGWRVCAEAADGREAVRLAEKLQPDVAVLDVTMPALDGVAACRAIRERSPRTCVLVLTVTEAPEVAARALAAGAHAYVLKGEELAHVTEAVEALSRGRTYLSGAAVDALARRVGEPQRVPALSLLTGRERVVARLVAEGKRTREVAQALGIGERTVESHRGSVMRKLQLQSLADLVRFAVRSGLVKA